MNKAQLVAEISKNTELSKKIVEKAINGFMDVVKDALKDGEKITLVGFGTFQVRQRKATKGINPQTMEKINIPAKKVAKLQFSEMVNDMLNK